MNALVQYIYSPAKMGMVELDGKKGMGRVLGQRVGVMVAYTDASVPGKYLIGVSFCKTGDKFNRREGLALSLARAIVWANRNRLPVFVKSYLGRKWFLAEFRRFQERCEKYFQGLKCVWDI